MIKAIVKKIGKPLGEIKLQDGQVSYIDLPQGFVSALLQGQLGGLPSNVTPDDGLEFIVRLPEILSGSIYSAELIHD